MRGPKKGQAEKATGHYARTTKRRREEDREV